MGKIELALSALAMLLSSSVPYVGLPPPIADELNKQQAWADYWRDWGIAATDAECRSGKFVAIFGGQCFIKPWGRQRGQD